MMRKKLTNEIGNIYGRLTVISRAENNKHGVARWLCECECGNKKIICGISLRSKNPTHSCGCLQKEAMLKRRRGDAVFNIILRNIKSDCKNRKIPFNLTLDDIKGIAVKPCAYCKREPYDLRCRYQRPNSKVENDCILLNGVDRVVPSLGYIRGNVEPCCKYCNRAKSDLTLDEFKNLIILLYKNYAYEIKN